MLLEKETIRCESHFNEDHSHRFLWKRIWNKDKPLATVIMLNACIADNQIMDTSTVLSCNNIARLNVFGGIQIVNLYSVLTSKLNFRWNSDEELNAPENDSYIKKAVAESEVAILAWGRSADNNQRIADRAAHVVNMLSEYKDKLMVISDGTRSGIHPLTPSVRHTWYLKSFTFPEENTAETKSDT